MTNVSSLSSIYQELALKKSELSNIDKKELQKSSFEKNDEVVLGENYDENDYQRVLNKFKNKVSQAREHNLDTDDGNDKKDEDENIDDPNDESWMTHALRCEDKAPVLAKDANTKGDDWFEIYDPRNPINKRRRGEASDKSKAEGHSKNRK